MTRKNRKHAGRRRQRRCVERHGLPIIGKMLGHTQAATTAHASHTLRAIR
jgi:hypothetical protein